MLITSVWVVLYRVVGSLLVIVPASVGTRHPRVPPLVLLWGVRLTRTEPSTLESPSESWNCDPSTSLRDGPASPLDTILLGDGLWDGHCLSTPTRDRAQRVTDLVRSLVDRCFGSFGPKVSCLGSLSLLAPVLFLTFVWSFRTLCSPFLPFVKPHERRFEKTHCLSYPCASRLPFRRKGKRTQVTRRWEGLWRRAR